MSDPKETSVPGTDAGSLAGRITKPDETPTAINTHKPSMSATANTFQPASGKSWADEVNSPVSANPDSAPLGLDSTTNSTATAEEKTPNVPQMDGATEPFNGSQLHEPDYMVELKLADMQADPNNPLYSIKTFEELGLQVTFRPYFPYQR